MGLRLWAKSSDVTRQPFSQAEPQLSGQGGDWRGGGPGRLPATVTRQHRPSTGTSLAPLPPRDGGGRVTRDGRCQVSPPPSGPPRRRAGPQRRAARHLGGARAVPPYGHAEELEGQPRPALSAARATAGMLLCSVCPPGISLGKAAGWARAQPMKNTPIPPAPQW